MRIHTKNCSSNKIKMAARKIQVKSIQERVSSSDTRVLHAIDFFFRERWRIFLGPLSPFIYCCNTVLISMHGFSSTLVCHFFRRKPWLSLLKGRIFLFLSSKL